ncbi:M23 family metallopeptidase [Pararhodospirillum photometricum]|nr:M23 family metallopeptidase [Pararhodospirillum photometricum]
MPDLPWGPAGRRGPFVMALLLGLGPGVALAAPPSLHLPVDCVVGETCHIVNSVDDDPGPGARDHRCGPVATNGHKGTDIGLGSVAPGRLGVVVAAAAGLVVAARDGMDDISVLTPGAPSVKDRECGNAVVLDHGDGWTSIYCHMAKGSIQVQAGQSVPEGAALGLIGLSGETEHPHLHFEVRHHQEVIDPFTGHPAAAGCAVAPAPLWQAPLPYEPTIAYNLGFAGEQPERVGVRAGRFADNTVSATAPILVLYVDLIAVQKNDRVTLAITDPAGQPFVTSVVPFDQQGWAQWFGLAGQKRGPAPWPSGVYTGTLTVERPGQGIIASRSVQGTVR